MKKIVKTIVIIIFCGCLVIGSSRRAEAAAEAGALTVIGGSIAAGGIGAALAAVAPVAIIVAGVALAAQGIYCAISDASAAEGMTNEDFIEMKLREFCDASGRSFEQYCNNVASGTRVLVDGTIALSNDASELISYWINSLVDGDQIAHPSAISQTVTISNVICPVVQPGEIILGYMQNNGHVISFENLGSKSFGICWTIEDNLFKIYAFQDAHNFTWMDYSNGYPISGYETTDYGDNANGLVYTAFTVAQQTVISEKYIPFVDDFEASLIAMNGNFVINQGSSVPEGDSFVSEGIVDTSVYNPTEGNVIILDPGLPLNDIANEYGKVGTISIDNYLDALSRSLNGVESNTIAISDALTGVLENVAVGTYNPVGDVTISEEDEERITAGIFTPAIDTELSPTGEAAEQSLEGLTFDLTDIFPFCIPFDLFALVEKFDASREIPIVQMNLPLPGLETTLDLDIDLTPFDTVATVLRTMELIAFVVGLAMVTRHIIRG